MWFSRSCLTHPHLYCVIAVGSLSHSKIQNSSGDFKQSSQPSAQESCFTTVAMSLQNDLKHIASEYAAYFPSISLVQHQQGSTEFSHLELQTLEGDELSIAVREQGWYVLGSHRYFDTFEALMNTHSPGFRNTFASNLFEKLQKLAQ